MAKVWIDSVKSSGKLTVYDGIGSGHWSGIVADCIDEINKLLTGVNVSFGKATDESSANIIVRTSDGPIVFDYLRDTYTKPFDGKSLIGHTYLIWREDDPKVEKAFTFLPSTPQISTPRGSRLAGINVVKCMLVHELIHGTGLENSDHGTEDLFYGYPMPDYGAKPEQDRLGLQVKGGSYVWFPPYFLTGATTGKIQALWK